MGKISANGALQFLKSMHAAGAVYLWGANCEVITEELLESLKDNFGPEHYEKVSLDKVEGKIGADCSGLAEPLSGEDNTAAGYYANCKKRGDISKMPKDKICLLFRKQKGKLVHMAFYTGDGMLYEMWSGCDHREFIESEWTYYGIPDWIIQEDLQDDKKSLSVGDKVIVKNALKRYNTARDAKNDMRVLKDLYEPGTFYVYKIDAPTGAVNISKMKGEKGSWVML